MKSNISTVNIMGVNVAAISMNELIDYTTNNITNIKGNYICVANVHTTVMAYENDEYLDIQNNSLLTIPDGGPLSSFGRKNGYPNMERTTGPDYMERIFEISEEKKYRHFFYGSTEDTLKMLKQRLKNKYKKINIVGMYSPPFRDLTEDEDKEIVDMINKTDPDFVWVGLGAPKQENWMYKHKGIINGLMVGVGAGFDYFAGNIKRAPEWMQKNNLEWLYRLIQDPKRLFKRYLVTNTKFLLYQILNNSKNGKK